MSFSFRLGLLSKSLVKVTCSCEPLEKLFLRPKEPFLQKRRRVNKELKGNQLLRSVLEISFSFVNDLEMQSLAFNDN